MEQIDRELQNLKDKLEKLRKELEDFTGNIERENFSESLQHDIFDSLGALDESVSVMSGNFTSIYDRLDRIETNIYNIAIVVNTHVGDNPIILQ